MLNLPEWGKGNFHAIEHWLIHLFDHHAERETATHRRPNKQGAVRKRHPLEELNDEN